MRRIMLIACAICALGLVGGSSIASAEDAPAGTEALALAAQDCAPNFVCIWNQINYEGSVEFYECAKVGTYATPFGNPYRSAKNKCGNKAVALAGPYPTCMEPGGERPSPGYFTGLTFYGYGEHC